MQFNVYDLMKLINSQVNVIIKLELQSEVHVPVSFSLTKLVK